MTLEIERTAAWIELKALHLRGCQILISFWPGHQAKAEAKQGQIRMKKAQAIQIIREEYQNGYSPTDIAQNLSQQLNAPFDLVYKFVMQTLGAELQAAEEPIPPPSPLAQPEPIVTSIPSYEMPPEEEPDQPGSPQPEGIFSPVMAPDLKTLEHNPKVEKFVLQLLMNNPQNNDTVLAVCEQTGLGWDDARRLVSNIAARNHKLLQARQNRLPMILSTLALLVGMLMVYAGMSESYNIYTMLQTENSNQELVVMAVTQEFLRGALWSLAIGGGLLMGGTMGLFIALRNQFS